MGVFLAGVMFACGSAQTPDPETAETTESTQSETQTSDNETQASSNETQTSAHRIEVRTQSTDPNCDDPRDCDTPEVHVTLALIAPDGSEQTLDLGRGYPISQSINNPPPALAFQFYNAGLGCDYMINRGETEITVARECVDEGEEIPAEELGSLPLAADAQVELVLPQN